MSSGLIDLSEPTDETRTGPPHFVSLGMFIIDRFQYLDEDGNDIGKEEHEQIGGGGVYAAIGARIWLPPHKVGAIIDKGHDFPPDLQTELEAYGKDMWLFRDNSEMATTRALNLYKGDHRGFEYLTPRRRITPKDLSGTLLERPANLHFICSPARAASIVAEIKLIPDWDPVTIYEPIPDRCVPEQLPALIDVLPSISILSPNAEEALQLLSMPLPPTVESIQEAAEKFLDFGVGKDGTGDVIIRSGVLGAFYTSRQNGGRWIDAYFNANYQDRVVDVTGAGNAFLGGLSAGLLKTGGVVSSAIFHAAISASFVVQQMGLPKLTGAGKWNGENPYHRIVAFRTRPAPRDAPNSAHWEELLG